MILGIGSDLIDIRRVEALMERFEERFLARCFTAREREKAERRSAGGGRVATYAKRFAAKEACSKALGTGFAKGVRMKDIGVVNDAVSGAPSLALTGGARLRLEAMTPPGCKPVLHLSLSDEPPVGYAHVVIEAVPYEAGGPGQNIIQATS